MPPTLQGRGLAGTQVLPPVTAGTAESHTSVICSARVQATCWKGTRGVGQLQLLKCQQGGWLGKLPGHHWQR